MKKLLTIMVLALALCLIGSVAFAANPLVTSEADFQKLVLDPDDAMPVASLTVDYKKVGNTTTFTRVTSLAGLTCGGTYTIRYEAPRPVGDPDTTNDIVFNFVWKPDHEKYPVLFENNPRNYDELVDKNTCTVGAMVTRHKFCRVCGAEKIEAEIIAMDTASHDFELRWRVEPDCENKGNTDYQCRRCGQWFTTLRKGEITDKQFSDYYDIAHGGLVDTKLIKTYKDSFAAIADTTPAIQALCKSSGFLTKDGNRENGHKFSNWATLKPETCTTVRVLERWCSVCSQVETKDTTIYLHCNYKLFRERRIDCFTVQLTFRCDYCKGTAPTVHPDIVVTLHDKSLPNPSPAFSTIVRSPAEAESQLTGTFGKWVVNFKLLSKVAAHEYDITDPTTLVGIALPTCTEDGFTAYRCIHEATCSPTSTASFDAKNNVVTYAPAENHPVLKVDLVPKLGHDWSEYQVVHPINEPGVGNKFGVWIRTCLRCGLSEQLVSDKDPINGHTHKAGEKISSTKATCTAEGYDIYKCKECNAQYKTNVVKALGHTKGALVEVITPNDDCEKAGKGKFYCTVCKTIYEDTIPATGHKWDAGVVTTEATVEKEGVKTFTCATCGKKRTESIAKVILPTAYKATMAFDKDTMTLTGKASLEKYTAPASDLFARITYFMADGTYTVVNAIVDAKGNFESMNSGEVIHIAVQIIDSNKIKPDTYERFGGTEIDVK